MGWKEGTGKVRRRVALLPRPRPNPPAPPTTPTPLSLSSSILFKLPLKSCHLTAPGFLRSLLANSGNTVFSSLALSFFFSSALANRGLSLSSFGFGTRATRPGREAQGSKARWGGEEWKVRRGVGRVAWVVGNGRGSRGPVVECAPPREKVRLEKTRRDDARGKVISARDWVGFL